jgi:hypothetical protein
MEKYAARCMPCENRRRWAIIKLTGAKRRERSYFPTKYKYPTENLLIGDYGSEALWSKYRGGRFVSVTCGLCRREHPIVASVAIKPGCTGLHKECFLQVYPLNVMYTHEPILPKGTKVLFHVRAQRNRHKVGIECRGCFNETRQIKYAWDKHIQSYIHGVIGVYALLRWKEFEDATLWCRLWAYLKRILFWDELCSDCVRKRGRSLNKFADKQIAPSGTVVYFDDEINGEVRVSYENPIRGCGCERRVKRDDAVSHWRKYPTVCFNHHNHPEAYAELMQARQVNSNGQKNGSAEKRHPGPKKGFNAKITEEKVREAFRKLVLRQSEVEG